MNSIFVLCLFLYLFNNGEVHSNILQSAKSIDQWIINIRRELHQIPELQFELHKTSHSVRGILDQLNISYRHSIAKTGIIAEIGSGTPVVGLRADMDALPIQEPVGLKFISKHDGKMHACGHDAHTAMLLGAARLLKETEGSFHGTVQLIFQPAEEVGRGARAMIKEGVIDGIEAMFGLHVWPTLESGKIATKTGVIMAAINGFKVTVTGRGGHAAMPSGAIDPAIPVANMILAYQTIISRSMDPREAYVISVTIINGGHAFNVIPDSITFAGTMRSLEPDGLGKLTEKFKDLTNRIAESYHCSAEVEITNSGDAVFNDQEATAFAMDSARRLIGEDRVLEAMASTGAEDFAYFGQKIPATFLFLGIRNETIGTTAELHNPNFKVDETVLHIGAALHTSLALDYLQKKHQTKEQTKTEL